MSAAHDMWLVTGIPGAEDKVCARIGERFPDTVNAPTADRVTLFQFRSRGAVEKLNGTLADKQFCAPLFQAKDGVAEMVVHPRLNRIDYKRFAEFVRGEGLQHVVRPTDSGAGEVGYLYSRYSKLLVGGAGESGLATEALGHVLEIIPMNPPAASLSDFQVRVMFRGKPLANAQVAAVHEGASPEAYQFPVVARTDAQGVAVLKLTRPGLWYARLIHTIPTDDPEFQWHHFFATLTFRVRTTPGK